MPGPIRILGARENNLRNISLEIPRYSLTVLTGVSGSGKSSLAFDTLFAEGQRRYVESLSAQARQLLGALSRPDVDLIEGLSPSVAVDQHSTQSGPRSTVGTLSEIGGYLRLLYSRVGEIRGSGDAYLLDADGIVERLLTLDAGTQLTLLAPMLSERKGAQKNLLTRLRRQGLVRVRLNGELLDLDSDLTLPAARRNNLDAVIDRLRLSDRSSGRLEKGVRLALKLGRGRIKVLCNGDEWHFAERGSQLCELSPSLFSFNSRSGACPECQGLGEVRRVSEGLVVADGSLSLAEGAIPYLEGARGAWLLAQIESLGKSRGFSLDMPFDSLSDEDRKLLLEGSDGEQVAIDVLFETRRGVFRRTFEGLVPYLERRYRETSSSAVRNLIERFQREERCPSCEGRRLSAEARRVSLGAKDFAQVSALTLAELRGFLASLSFRGLRKKVADEIMTEITAGLDFLEKVGLGYLSLDRPASTLSGGERQRLALAEQLGSRMTGVLYILDEPSIGIHPRDHRALLDTLEQLRDRGNTVLVVEHDRETIETADWVIDLGPGAGELGGTVVAEGPPDLIRENGSSPTGQALRQSAQAIGRVPRKGNGNSILIRGASQHNLRDLDLDLPLGLLICVTGVSGSGKSTLVRDILYAHLAREKQGFQGPLGACGSVSGGEELSDVILVDQAPIGRSSRSNPATYSGAWGEIRKLFAQLPESRIRGYGPGRFSFNVKGGRCEACRGDGERKVTLHFLPPAWVACETCRSRRFNRETLEIHYRGRSIAEVLEMTVDRAIEHFSEIPRVLAPLRSLSAVGLGYLRLGQSARSLSGGEAQRLKLARQLSRSARGSRLYILDEPSTGLHFLDVEVLMNILQRLVDKGHSVIIIEHNPDIIREADWIVDLGPEGGPGGGEVLVTGSPAQVAACRSSHTGAVLRRLRQDQKE